MKFCWTTLHVKDMDKSLEFYQGILGLDLNRRNRISPEMELAFLGSGETQVELIRDSRTAIQPYGEGVSMGFQAESLDKVRETLAVHGVPVHSGPFQPNPSIRFLYVRDPDGMNIQFIEFLK